MSIPENIKYSLDLYVNHYIQPGHFLTAVLENNLFEAFARADLNSRAALFDICGYIYNDIPGSCWGSPERVKEWLEKRT